ncbi:MAG: polysaccharide deacetylase family protein [Pseudomonadota bacterium]
MSRTGIFTVSLDFELFWGVCDHKTLSNYGKSLLGARQAIPILLDTFKEYDIHVTWATVGFLFAANKDELNAHLPTVRPAYSDNTLDPYPRLAGIGQDEQNDPYHYANSLIKKIASYQGQELASHTFSHYYCLEPGQTREAFCSDLESALKIAKSYGFNLRSLVFPRNQYNADYLTACDEYGITAYRGNQSGWMYEARNKSGNTWYRRLARLVDAYIRISGNNTYDIYSVSHSVPVNVPASRLLRPVSNKLKYLEPLRLARIKSEMSAAARYGRLYHLWWHPHNFGSNTAENILFLRKILSHFRCLQQAYGMRSMHMSEVACEMRSLASRDASRQSDTVQSMRTASHG